MWKLIINYSLHKRSKTQNIYHMVDNICSSYIVRFYCQTVQFSVCRFYLCDWAFPHPIIACANTFQLSGCAFGNLSSSSTGEVPTSFKLVVPFWAVYLPIAALSSAVIRYMSHDDIPAFLPSLWTPPRLFSLAVRDDGLAVVLSLEK